MSDGFHPEASDTIVLVDGEQVPTRPDAMLPAQADYFGFSKVTRHFFPDGASYVELKLLNEGERRRYLNETNREVKFARGSGDAHLRMRPGDDKHVLLKVAIVGWNLTKDGNPLPFNENNLDKFLSVANPKVIDDIEKDIRKANTWLLADMAPDDIRKEIANLEEMLAAAVAEEAGKDTSTTK